MANKKLQVAFGTATIIGFALVGCTAAPETSTVAENCVPAHAFETIEKGVLTVTMYDLPPITAYNNGDPEGVDVDIVQAIADLECLTVKWQSNAPAANIPAVQSDRADIATGAIYRTATRAETLSLSDPVYLDNMGLVSKKGFISIEELESARTGVIDGYLWVEDMKKLLGDKLLVYPSSVEMYSDLETGRIDVGVDSYASAAYSFKDKSEYKVTIAEPDVRIRASVEAAQITLPSTKGNKELTAAINADIDSLRNSGTLAEILEKHNIDVSALEVGQARLIK